MKFAGIYVIQNIVNNRIYIGSSNNIQKRKISHFGKLRLNKHVNSKLQYAFNKYGEDNFVFNLLEKVENINDLLDREQVWLDFFKPEYNIMPFADRHEFSEDTRLKLSESHKGNKHTEHSKIKIGLASKGNKYRLGTKWSEEERIGRKCNGGHKGKLGVLNHNYGKKRPKEVTDRCKATRLKNKIHNPDCHCGKPFHAKELCKYHYKIEYRKIKKYANII